MQMPLEHMEGTDIAPGDTVNGITYRWAVKDDIPGILACADDACQYQDEKFSKYYANPQ